MVIILDYLSIILLFNKQMLKLADDNVVLLLSLFLRMTKSKKNKKRIHIHQNISKLLVTTEFMKGELSFLKEGERLKKKKMN